MTASNMTHLSPQAECFHWLTKVTPPRSLTLPEVTCVYGIDGKCSGTITLPSAPQHFTGCIYPARQQGIHALLSESPCPRPCNRNPWTTALTPTTLNDMQQYQGWILTLSGWPPFPWDLHNHALVTKERMASPLYFTPVLQESWTAHPRESFDDCVLHRSRGDGKISYYEVETKLKVDK
jgi:hypothetical protein